MSVSPTPSIADSFAEAVAGATGPFHYEGDTVLVYRGAAESVRLVTWMPRFPPNPPFSRAADGTWYLRLPLPGTARIEYRLALVATKGHKGVEEIHDPLNPPVATNPFGRNSVVTGEAYQPSLCMSSVSAGQGGHLSEIRVSSRLLGGRRHHHLYLPNGHDAHRPYPVLFVHDGSDFVRYGGFTACLDLLIEQGEVSPLVAVLVDPWNRMAEYAANPLHSAHLVDEVMPHLGKRMRAGSEPSQVGVLGSSLGAVASLAAAWHNPTVFGRVGLLSGSFVHTTDSDWPGPVSEEIVSFLVAMQAEIKLEGPRIYQSVGRYEGLIDFNRRLAPILRAGGAHLQYRETWDGHDWGSWRDRLPEALSFLFPGPAAAAAKN